MLPELTTIQARRRALGMAQHRLASDAGCTQSYLGKVERGKVVPLMRFFRVHAFSASTFGSTAGASRSLRCLR